ncbi:MAG: transposase [Phycisphaerales bacterium]|nr:transposase [Phycisphaerales bacterium]
MTYKYTPEQIVSKLRHANRELGKGQTVKEVCRTIEISEQTYYRWRQKYGGMSPDMIKQLRLLQKENKRLRRVVSDQALDITILKEAAEGNF